MTVDQQSWPKPHRGVRRVSPAAHLADRFEAATVTGERGVSLRERPFVTMVGLRVPLGSSGGLRSEPLPRRCGETVETDRGSVLWLSPDEFLLVSDLPAADLVADQRQALGESPGSVVDVSANRTTLELSGPSARAVLEKGCALDLHPRRFAERAAYLTLIGTVPVIIWRTGAEEFRVLPRSSYADFLGRWLIDAMAEFAVAEPARWWSA